MINYNPKDWVNFIFHFSQSGYLQKVVAADGERRCIFCC